MNDRNLITYAVDAMKNAYAPYSRFSVGAAIECRDGSVYCGCNIENVAFGCSMCAERVALGNAITNGHRDFVKIAVVSNGSDYCFPCGTCRQVLAEFDPEIEVLCVRGDGRYVSYHLSQLLGCAFLPSQLN